MNHLTKETSQDALRNYFAGVITLSRSNNPFPVDLDDVWPLLYTSKGQAVRELKRKRKEGFDFIVKTGEVLPKKVKTYQIRRRRFLTKMSKTSISRKKI